MQRLVASSFLVLSLAACSSTVVESNPPPGPGPVDPGTNPPPAKCESAACPGDQSCRDEVCADPTERQKTQAAAVATFAEALAESSAWPKVVDLEAVKKTARTMIMKGDGTDAPYFAAAWYTLNQYPQGHQGLYSSDKSVCGKLLPQQQASRFGVCGRPSKDGLAVTYAAAGNKLGLAVGDVVVTAGADSGDAIFEASFARPTCGGTFPAASGRRYSGAASFFGNVPVGTKLKIKNAAGAIREITVPTESDAKVTDCTDPFVRSRAIYAEAKVRPDGVAVIRLPSFFPFDKAFPSTQSETDKLVAEYQAEIVKVFESVKSAPGIIWDARGNSGGISKVGLAIVSGFPSAKAKNISYCRLRTPGTSPPAYDFSKYAEYAVTPGGPFAYTGKVAVVTDGIAYSAGDYFPLAALEGSDAPVVGSASAGAYGATSGSIDVAGLPKLVANFDANGCFDAATNTNLEASPPAPTVPVEYEQADLAAGRDTIVEAAVKALGF